MKTSPGYQRISALTILVVLLALLPWGHASAAGAANPEASTPVNHASLDRYLAVDGSLSLPGNAPQRQILAGEDNTNWEAGFTLPGANFSLYALAWDGANLYLAGWFTSMGDIQANYILRWDGHDWQTLGESFNSSVNALLWTGSELYAGGSFTRIGAATVNRVARWNGSAWSALGPTPNGLTNGVVYALAWDGANLYAGGSFRNAGSLVVNRVARWNGAAWSALALGIDPGVTGVTDYNAVYTLAWNSGILYAGGIFYTAGLVAANHIAQWNGATWSGVGGGMDAIGYTWTLLWIGSDMYAAGNFTSAGGTPVNYIARWDGSAWYALGTGVNSGSWGLAWDGSNLYAGGSFTTAGGAPAHYIARWDGATWHGLEPGFDNYSNVILWNGSDLFVGGDFTRAGDEIASHLARWDGSAWAPMVNAGNGVSNPVHSLLATGNGLYAGGDFTSAGNIITQKIAHWDGSAWNALGTGTNGRVKSLAWNDASSLLYAGGEFTTAGGAGANRIAAWDGGSWATLGSGMNGNVNSLLWNSTFLYAGGEFTSAGGSGANRVARWNGATWAALGSGTNGRVDALAWDGTTLYAGGAFSTAGGAPAAFIASWNGASWGVLGSGMNDVVNALLWDGTTLYAAGDFTTAGGSPANYIAAWNGASWTTLGSGMNAPVNALAWDGAYLYAAGEFSTAGGTAANRIARWDGVAWSGLGVSGSGISCPSKPYPYTPPPITTPISFVYSLALDTAQSYPDLWVGGVFCMAGSTVSNNIAHWRQAAIWDGGGSDMNASTPGNWNADSLPTSADVLVFDATSPKHAILDAAFVSSLGSIHIRDTYQGVITLTTSLHLTGDLILQAGSFTLPDPASATFTVGGAVQHSGGRLRQETVVQNESVAFLEIGNGLGAIKYRGVTLSTSADLGSVSVSVRKINPDTGEYCNTSGGSLPSYANRCFEIAPTSGGSATLRLWALTSELNAIPTAALSVYHYTSGRWNELTNGRINGSQDEYSYAEGLTSGFSPFLLAREGYAPTAIHLNFFSARSTNDHSPLLLQFLASIGLVCMLGLLIERMRSRLITGRQRHLSGTSEKDD